MKFFLSFTISSDGQMKQLKHSPHLKKRYKAVIKALEYLINNPRHPGLYTHEYTSLKGPAGEKIFEAYAEQPPPGAYRIFFYYGKTKGEIVIIAIIPHP